MTDTVKKRLIKFLASLIIFGIAILIIVYNLRDNIVYFYSPSEIIENNHKGSQIVRLGGLVESESVVSDGDSIFHFKITDGQEQISVKYQGILPNLFAEEKGVVVEGLYMNDGRFIANKVLAKHDENYMPPEVIKSLKETGKWQE